MSIQVTLITDPYSSLVQESRSNDSYCCVLIQELMMNSVSNAFMSTKQPMNRKRPHMILICTQKSGHIE